MFVTTHLFHIDLAGESMCDLSIILEVAVESEDNQSEQAEVEANDTAEMSQTLELPSHQGLSFLSPQASLMVETKDIARLKLIISDLERKVISRSVFFL